MPASQDDRKTPMKVLFEDLRSNAYKFDHQIGDALLSYKDLRAGAFQAEKKTWLSRLKSASPAEISEMQDPPHFKTGMEFSGGVKGGGLVGETLDKLQDKRGKRGWGYREIEAHYKGEAADAMASALRCCGIDAKPYRNLVARLDGIVYQVSDHKAKLLLALFIATGCWPSDPAAAWREVCGYARNALMIKSLAAPRIPATVNDEGRGVRAVEGDGAPGLCRLYLDGNKTFYPLDPDGTTVGMVPDPSVSFISDVEDYVSDEHLLVWRDDDGRWICQGLGSTNGTMLRRAGEAELIPVEHALREYRGSRERDEVELHNGDVLVLARLTEFRVVNLPVHEAQVAAPEPGVGLEP